jgi:hypothetical protein
MNISEESSASILRMRVDPFISVLIGLFVEKIIFGGRVTGNSWSQGRAKGMAIRAAARNGNVHVVPRYKAEWWEIRCQ